MLYFIFRKDDDDWVKKCKTKKVEEDVAKGRPKKTWEEVIKSDLKQKGVARDLAKNRLALKVNLNEPSNTCQNVKQM